MGSGVHRSDLVFPKQRQQREDRSGSRYSHLSILGFTSLNFVQISMISDDGTTSEPSEAMDQMCLGPCLGARRHAMSRNPRQDSSIQAIGNLKVELLGNGIRVTGKRGCEAGKVPGVMPGQTTTDSDPNLAVPSISEKCLDSAIGPKDQAPDENRQARNMGCADVGVTGHHAGTDTGEAGAKDR